MAIFDARKEIPGYAEFLDEQEAVRDTAFLRLPRRVCGLDILPLTTRHLLWLLTAESPFVGASPLLPHESHIHVATFLRILSTGFRPLSRWRRRLFFWHYRHKVYPLKLTIAEAVQEITHYLDKQMQDRPATNKPAGESYWSLAAGIVHFLAGQYGWNLDQALDTPLAVAFQLMKIQRAEEMARNGKRPTLFNPSDGFKTRWFQKLDQDMAEYEWELSQPKSHY